MAGECIYDPGPQNQSYVSGICKKWDPIANEQAMVVYWQDLDLKQQGKWGVNQSKQTGRADNTIRAGRMTTEPVRGGSGLEQGGGSSRGRVRQEDRGPVAWSESQNLHQSSHQVGTHRTRDLTRESGELLPGSRGQRPWNLGKGHDNKDETQDNTKYTRQINVNRTQAKTNNPN